MGFITFIFGVVLGTLAGLLFYKWWVTSDIKDMKKHIKKLEEDVEIFSRTILRGSRVTHYINGIRQEDEVIGHYKNRTEEKQDV